jgi:aryl-alcohol dehydrogenase-like predicted oxidoreductase
MPQTSRRQLGRSALQVSPLCFGGNVFGWTVDEKTAFSILDAWVDAGFNFIDTADVYSRWAPGNSGGESEAIIGKWIKQGGRRDRIVLATKIGSAEGNSANLKADYIRQGVEDSLRRLNTDCIDLYQAHKDDQGTPLQETLEAFGKLVAQGKVRVIGCSNYSAARLRESLEVSAKLGLPRYESLQPLYNLYEREEFEKDLQQLCVEQGISVINFYALASGFLSGKYRTPEDASKSARGKNTVAKYLNDRGLKILAALDQAADRTGGTPAQIAIAWVMAQPGITSPIASASSLDQLQDLVKATALVLDADTLAMLNAASA